MLLSKVVAMFLAMSLVATPVSTLAAVSAGATTAGIPSNLMGGISRITGATSVATGLSFGGIVSAPYFVCNTGFLFWVVPRGMTQYAGPVMWLPGSKPNSITFSA